MLRAGTGPHLLLFPTRPYGKDVPRLDYWLTYETIMKKVGGRPHWAKVGFASERLRGPWQGNYDELGVPQRATLFPGPQSAQGSEAGVWSAEQVMGRKGSTVLPRPGFPPHPRSSSSVTVLGDHSLGVF